MSTLHVATPAVARSPPETSDGRRAWPPSRPPTVRGGGLRHGRGRGTDASPSTLFVIDAVGGRTTYERRAPRTSRGNAAAATKDAIRAPVADRPTAFGRLSSVL